jgi:hypothetical protein
LLDHRKLSFKNINIFSEILKSGKESLIISWVLIWKVALILEIRINVEHHTWKAGHSVRIQLEYLLHLLGHVRLQVVEYFEIVYYESQILIYANIKLLIYRTLYYKWFLCDKQLLLIVYNVLLQSCQ